MLNFRRISGYGALAAFTGILFALGTAANADNTSPVQAQAAPAAPGSAVSGNGITLHSVSAGLATGSLSFDVPGGGDALNTNCVACHSTGMILNQPALTQAQWSAEVTHMRKDFKAPIADADVPAIIAELARIKGAK